MSLRTAAPGAPRGDIDVLFSAPNLPEQAVAYQIKRIKLGIDQVRNGTPGKIQEFKKLAQQANLLAQWDSGRYTPPPSWSWMPESRTRKSRKRGVSPFVI